MMESNRYRVHVLSCVDCADWSGRCRKGRKNKVASDVVCSEFADKITDRWSTLWSKTDEATSKCHPFKEIQKLHSNP